MSRWWRYETLDEVLDEVVRGRRDPFSRMDTDELLHWADSMARSLIADRDTRRLRAVRCHVTAFVARRRRGVELNTALSRRRERQRMWFGELRYPSELLPPWGARREPLHPRALPLVAPERQLHWFVGLAGPIEDPQLDRGTPQGTGELGPGGVIDGGRERRGDTLELEERVGEHAGEPPRAKELGRASSDA